MSSVLRLDRGTLVMREVPEAVSGLFAWDDRSQNFRAPGQAYREVLETLLAAGVSVRDEAAGFSRLHLGYARELPPYPHQQEALAAWKRAGRRGIVVLPTGSGKTLLAQLALRDTPRTTLITVPTLDLMGQWYSGLLAAFPDADVGLLGGGSRDQSAILVSTYLSAAIHAEELAGRYALHIYDEVHHLAGEYLRVIAQMGLAPYRLGLTATLQEDANLETLVGPVVYRRRPEELAGDTLAPYREVIIRVRLSETEQRRYEELIRVRNEFLRRSGIRLGSLEGWNQFVLHSGSPQGREAMLAHREARGLAYGTGGKLRVLEELLAQHPRERTLIFTDDNSMVYKISREFLIPALTHQTGVKERHGVLERFRDGTYRTLVTSRVLNEGIDVPEASIGIVLSGTATEREYIQRLGRLLRKSQDKQAVLYEVITEGTTEERVSQQRRGQWQPRRVSGWEDVNAPD